MVEPVLGVFCRVCVVCAGVLAKEQVDIQVTVTGVIRSRARYFSSCNCKTENYVL